MVDTDPRLRSSTSGESRPQTSPGTSRADTGVRFGDFLLLKKLATGGMGEIFLAKQSGPEGFEKILAIKRILQHYADEPRYVDMFYGEARVAALLNHSNIAQVYSMGEVEEHLYIAMEYVHGRSLKELLVRSKRRERPIAVQHVCDMMGQACMGLSYAHNLRDSVGEPVNLVHRDINPQNLLVSYHGELKIIDFGIAKSAMSIERTKTGTIKGKLVYLSPEQSAARTVDKRSDLFSLGIVLYELLSGENPFAFENIVQSLDAIQNQMPRPIGEVRPEAAIFQPVIERALAKDPDARYGDAREMYEDLEQLVLAGQMPAAAESLPAYLAQLFADCIEEDRQVLIQTGSGIASRASSVDALERGASTQLAGPIKRSLGDGERTERARPSQEVPAPAAPTGDDEESTTRARGISDEYPRRPAAAAPSTLAPTELHAGGDSGVDIADEFTAALPAQDDTESQSMDADLEEESRFDSVPPPTLNETTALPAGALEGPTARSGVVDDGFDERTPLWQPAARAARVVPRLVGTFLVSAVITAGGAGLYFGLRDASPASAPLAPVASGEPPQVAAAAPEPAPAPEPPSVETLSQPAPRPPEPVPVAGAHITEPEPAPAAGAQPVEPAARARPRRAEEPAPAPSAMAQDPPTAREDSEQIEWPSALEGEAANGAGAATPERDPAARGDRRQEPKPRSERDPEVALAASPEAPEAVEERGYGRLIVNPGPNMRVRHGKTSVLGSTALDLAQVRGRVTLQDPALHLTVQLDYRVDTRVLRLKIDATPWAIVAADEINIGRTPQRVAVSRRVKLALRNPSFQDPVEITIFYQP